MVFDMVSGDFFCAQHLVVLKEAKFSINFNGTSEVVWVRRKYLNNENFCPVSKHYERMCCSDFGIQLRFLIIKTCLPPSTLHSCMLDTAPGEFWWDFSGSTRVDHFYRSLFDGATILRNIQAKRKRPFTVYGTTSFYSHTLDQFEKVNCQAL